MNQGSTVPISFDNETATIEQGRNADTLDLLSRLRSVLTRADIDCDCRERLSGALDRFSDLEARRLTKRSLIRARDHRNRIAAILALMSEINQLTESEKDRSVFLEMALLFDEISHSAAVASSALRDIGETGSSASRYVVL